jgi:hypothetical protein
MKRTIEINSQHIESIEVFEKLELEDYEHYPSRISRWFWESDYPEIFVINYFDRYLRSDISTRDDIFADGDQLFFYPHLQLKMISGETHEMFFKNIGELKHKIDILKIGVDDYFWKKILI